jgi:hypothetical protein
MGRRLHVISSAFRSSIGRSALVAAVLALGTSPLLADSFPGVSLSGTWVWTTFLGPATGIPALVTYLADGTIVGSDSTMLGSIPGYSFKTTPFHGVWKQLGRRRFGGTSIELLFDPDTSELIGFLRARAAIRLQDRDHISGTMLLDMLPCPTALTCPDPTQADASWIPLGDPANGFPFQAVRLHRVPTP